MPNIHNRFCVNCVHFSKRGPRSTPFCAARLRDPDPVYGYPSPLMTASDARSIIGACKPEGLLFERKKNLSPAALTLAVIILIATYLAL